jgi:hypothetical protein
MSVKTRRGRPPKGRLNPPLPLRRIAEQPSWIFKDLAPMSPEVRRPLQYAQSVLLWKRVRQRGYTMLGCRRGRTLFRLAREVERQDVPGALVDCGVWNGGSTALLSAGAPTRDVYAFDSFEGLPPSDEELDGQDSVDRAGWCLGVEDNVRDALQRFGSPEHLHIVKGWFEDSFPREGAEVGPIAVLHDYGVWSGARQAVDEFRSARSIEQPLVTVEAAAYWRKAG